MIFWFFVTTTFKVKQGPVFWCHKLMTDFFNFFVYNLNYSLATCSTDAVVSAVWTTINKLRTTKITRSLRICHIVSQASQNQPFRHKSERHLNCIQLIYNGFIDYSTMKTKIKWIWNKNKKKNTLNQPSALTTGNIIDAIRVGALRKRCHSNDWNN